MAAVLGGLGAAVIWAVGTAFSSRAARALGPTLTLAWVMLIGLLAMAMALPWAGHVRLSPVVLVWLVVSGTGNVVGLLILYHALRIGQMGVVMPIAGTEGGIAALIAIIAGQPVSGLVGSALTVTVLGVMMTAVARRPVEPPAASGAGHVPAGHGDRRAGAWAVVGALSFGVSLFATGRAGALIPPAWAVLPPRVIGVLVVTIPLALRGRLVCAPGAARLLIVAGLCEVGGFFAYALGARHGIAVAAVLATLTGAISVGFGRLLFGERLRVTQLVGVVIIFAGVATITAATA